MRWIGGRESSNVDDRRGLSAGGVAAGGGIIGVIALYLIIFLEAEELMMDQAHTNSWSKPGNDSRRKGG